MGNEESPKIYKGRGNHSVNNLEWLVEHHIEENKRLEAELAEAAKVHSVNCPYPDCGRSFWYDTRKNPPKPDWDVTPTDYKAPPKYSVVVEENAKLRAALKEAIDHNSDALNGMVRGFYKEAESDVRKAQEKLRKVLDGG